MICECRGLQKNDPNPDCVQHGLDAPRKKELMADTDYWKNLIKALEMLSWHQTGPFPTHCEHDELWVMSDPSKYAPEELERLAELGFTPNDEASFHSYVFGSA